MSWEGKDSCSLVGVKEKGGERGSSWVWTGGQRGEQASGKQGCWARAGSGGEAGWHQSGGLFRGSAVSWVQSEPCWGEGKAFGPGDVSDAEAQGGRRGVPGDRGSGGGREG